MLRGSISRPSLSRSVSGSRHPQSDRQVQFGVDAGNPTWAHAVSHLAHHCRNDRTVYSFCMPRRHCGLTSEEAVCTNGMSQYSPKADATPISGLVIARLIRRATFPGDPARGDRLTYWESLAYVAGWIELQGPARKRLGNFLAGRLKGLRIGNSNPTSPGAHDGFGAMPARLHSDRPMREAARIQSADRAMIIPMW
jgi:uncharacterized FAD-dependent dehydrogenase